MQKIFEFVQDGIGEDGKAFGHFESTGVRPTRSWTASNPPG